MPLACPIHLPAVKRGQRARLSPGGSHRQGRMSGQQDAGALAVRAERGRVRGVQVQRPGPARSAGARFLARRYRRCCRPPAVPGVVLRDQWPSPPPSRRSAMAARLTSQPVREFVSFRPAPIRLCRPTWFPGQGTSRTGRWPVTDIWYPDTAIDGVPVVAAPAEIDITNADGLRSALLRAAAAGSGTLVVDMAQTQFCDSSGLHPLVAAVHQGAGRGRTCLRARRRGASRRVRRVQADVRETRRPLNPGTGILARGERPSLG
jgi:anti-sigma B factor antagonist